MHLATQLGVSHPGHVLCESVVVHVVFQQALQWERKCSKYAAWFKGAKSACRVRKATVTEHCVVHLEMEVD